MYVYININDFEKDKIVVLNKIKNKYCNGFFYKIYYETETYTMNNLIIKINNKNILDLYKIENELLDFLNIKNLKKTYNIDSIIKDIDDNDIYLKICGYFLNNNSYGLVYKIL